MRQIQNTVKNAKNAPQKTTIICENIAAKVVKILVNITNVKPKEKLRYLEISARNLHCILVQMLGFNT